MAGSFSSSSMAVIGVVAIFGLLLAILSPAVVDAQSPAPAPAPTSDGKLNPAFFRLDLKPWTLSIFVVFVAGDFNRPRDCIRADARGAGAHVPHPPS
ncbi:hypothetical protein FH972_003834 [Carpinus fangiana]|uniref:Uncharacterized protein n=1 Tax=Carpinus fangiana TaxID=176857 RepID=A0A5N6QL69_9ROSI|nr:hypothetical protein FH972_003834 [Carpinus fangiana]